jgi:hypothetical protein
MRLLLRYKRDEARVLVDLVGDTDLIVLCETRAGSRTWRSSPGDLPDKLARRFPETSLLVVHPAEPQDDASAVLAAHHPAEREGPKVPLDHVVMNLSADSIKAAAVCLLRYVPGLNGDGTTAALLHKLVDDAEELAPGVVLVHAETELAEEPTVVFGVSKEGVPWSAEKNTAHVFVLLVDPPGRDATRHLQNLAAVARMFHSADVIERVRVAADERELRELLIIQQQRPSVAPPGQAVDVA